ncbi:MAG: hypothetical protein HC836_36095 [Richelia sp. RM2_1_2]|nr:hypothetical protein [Richelia sp. RM2_1_2]
MNKHRIQILEANYWEHYKFAKDIAMFLPIDDPKRIIYNEELDRLLKELNELKDATNKK